MGTHSVRPSIWSSFRRAVSWHRRKLAVLAAVTAVLASIQAASPAAPSTVAVVVTVQALPGGHTIAAGDVELREMPEQALPDQVVRSPVDVVGRTLAAPASTGQMLIAADVVSPRMTTGDGSAVVTPLRLSDPQVAGLLAVGDEVDVVAADPREEGRTRVLAERARVVAVPSATEAGDGPLGMGGGGSSSGTLVLVAVPPEVAKDLASAAATSQVSIMWRS